MLFRVHLAPIVWYDPPIHPPIELVNLGVELFFKEGVEFPTKRNEKKGPSFSKYQEENSSSSFFRRGALACQDDKIVAFFIICYNVCAWNRKIRKWQRKGEEEEKIIATKKEEEEEEESNL